jgi:hypothetical protein
MKSRRISLALAAVVLLLAGWLSWRSTLAPAGAPAASPQSTPASSPAIAGAESGQLAPGLPAKPSGAAPAPQAAPATTATPAPAQYLSATPGAAPPAQANRAAPTASALAMVELQKVHQMVESYHTLMGQNPVGTNAEIMKALMGGNPHQAMLGPPPGQSLNAKGELLDPWGTPYFFHQLSGDDMEIHSAGPDRIMGTKDDLVIP